MASQYVMEYPSPLGTLTLACDGESLTGLWFAGQKYFASTLEKDACRKPHPLLLRAAGWLDCYFSGQRPQFTVPLAPRGTAFQQSVWRLLCTIPYGTVTTYGQLAQQLALQGHKTSARAVGSAVGRNPVSIFIPCHRVIGASGSLTGYAGGIDKKRALLALEQAKCD